MTYKIQSKFKQVMMPAQVAAVEKHVADVTNARGELADDARELVRPFVNAFFTLEHTAQEDDAD